MISINTFLKQLIYYFPAQIYPSVMNLFIIMILARELTLEQYGEYSLYIVIISFGSILITQWFIQAIYFYYPQYSERKLEDEFIHHYKKGISFFIIMTIFILIILGIIEVFSSFYLEIVILIICVMLTQSIFTLEQVLLQSKMDHKKYTYKSFVVTTLKFIFIIGILLYLEPSVEYILLCIFFSYLMLIINKFKGYFSKGNINLEESSKKFYKKTFLYGAPLLGWYLCTSFMHLSDRILIKYLNNSEEMALYSGNYSIISAGLGLIFVPLNTVVQPIIMKKVAETRVLNSEIENLIKKITLIYFIIGLPIILIIDLLKNEIVFLLLGEKYVEGSNIITYLMIGMLLWSVSQVGHKGLEIKKQTTKMFYFILVTCVCNLLINFILVNSYSYTGAAIGNMLSFSLYCILVFINSRRKSEIRWGVNVKEVTIAIFVALIIYVSLYLLNEMYFSGVNIVANLLIITIIYIAVYGIVIFYLIKQKKINIRF